MPCRDWLNQTTWIVMKSAADSCSLLRFPVFLNLSLINFAPLPLRTQLECLSRSFETDVYFKIIFKDNKRKRMLCLQLNSGELFLGTLLILFLWENYREMYIETCVALHLWTHALLDPLMHGVSKLV